MALEHEELEHRATRKSGAVTFATLEPIVKALTDGTLQHVRRLEARIAELEARPALKYVGTFKRDDAKSYAPNALCTHKGSLWICRTPTTAEPGSCTDWQMISRGVR